MCSDEGSGNKTCANKPREELETEINVLKEKIKSKGRELELILATYNERCKSSNKLEIENEEIKGENWDHKRQIGDLKAEIGDLKEELSSLKAELQKEKEMKYLVCHNHTKHTLEVIAYAYMYNIGISLYLYHRLRI